MTASDPSPQQMQKQNVAGYDIAIRREGERGALPIVMVHGIGVSSRYFVPLMKELAGEYEVIALDLPGYGESPKPPRPLTVPELAEVVGTYLRQEGRGPAVIVGHSMGCQVAAHVARHYPELCKQLVFLGPTVNRRERTWWWQAWRLLQDIWSEPVAVNLIIFRDYIRMGFFRYLVTLRYMLDDRIEDTMSGCLVSTLLIRGAKDTIVSSEWLRYLARQLPHSTVHEALDGPHAIQMSRPRELATVISAFVKE